MERLTIISELNWAISQAFRWNGGIYENKSDLQFWKNSFQKVNWLVGPVSPKSCKVLQLKETYNLYSIKAASNSLEFTSEEKEENL